MPAVRIGLIGKTNTGKTTFFNSATLQSAEMNNYPFTTKSPNSGVGHAATLCVHRELGVKVDNPRNSICADGWRIIPIEVIDLPGLIKGAWEGRGLGNQFLTVAAQSDALLHIVDASGSIDADGKISSPGVGDPVADIADIEEELAMWYLKIFENSFDRIVRTMKGAPMNDFAEIVSEQMMGVGVKRPHVVEALNKHKLYGEDLERWTDDQRREFAWSLREVSKPTLIVANKMDVPEAAKNFQKIRESYHDMITVPASAESELTLRRAEQSGVIKYLPGEERFDIEKDAKLNRETAMGAVAHQQGHLGRIHENGGAVCIERRCIQAAQNEFCISRFRPCEIHRQLGQDSSRCFPHAQRIYGQRSRTFDPFRSGAGAHLCSGCKDRTASPDRLSA